MSELAVLGGTPVRDTEVNPWTHWPISTEHEETALIEVLRSGIWSYNGPKEREFNRAFADFIGTRYALSVANGTVALQLALEACGVGLGDEVIVPGLTWQATAACVVDINAVPILVDVCQDTWCLDVDQVEGSITSRTKAIIPVHLYGSFVDMDRIMGIAEQHKLWVRGLCSQTWRRMEGQEGGKHWTHWQFQFSAFKAHDGRRGGRVDHQQPGPLGKLDALRNCGRRPHLDSDAEKGTGVYEDEGGFIQSGNYRIADFQAALLLECLERLPYQNQHRDQNAKYLNQLLSDLPGVVPMWRDERENLEAYYNFAFRFLEEDFKELPVGRFREALSHELGCTVEACYEPLNSCALYNPHSKPWRHKLGDGYWLEIDPNRFQLPNCRKAREKESVCFHFTVLMGPRSDMEQVAEAVLKIYEHVEDLV